MLLKSLWLGPRGFAWLAELRGRDLPGSRRPNPASVTCDHAQVRVNLFDSVVEHDADDPEGYRGGGVRLAHLLGAARLGATLYELPPGQGIAPYHYEYGNEEWLLVLSGAPALRHPDGEDELVAGDLVCFAEGAEGAHKLTNQSEETVRVLMFSTVNEPAVVVYPDSDKIGIWPGDHRDNVMVRREDTRADYWVGEA